jgi:hypothetical protein
MGHILQGCREYRLSMGKLKGIVETVVKFDYEY